jgi:L-threonylcarbamoyladenylate synthase
MHRTLPDVLPIEWPEGSPQPPASTEQSLDRAADRLRAGGLVAIPTETVYGLAADALDADAVRSIFRAKGRPAGNPLIVHVADVAMARGLAEVWPAAAERITSRLWPGPVTVVVPRNERVPDAVTAGGPTVAVRCPGNRLTRRLIEKVGRPLAAPSANRSEAVSPTTAHHVLESLGGRIDLILDGGPCPRGIESTVVDCTVTPPRILRPGPVDREAIEAALGQTVATSGDPATMPPDDGQEPAGCIGPDAARSPGTQRRHYAPRTPLEIAADPADRVAGLARQGGRIGWLTMLADRERLRAVSAAGEVVIVPMPATAELFARQLYATLHAIDRRGLDRIVVDALPDTEAWRAVHDRLSRASHPASPTETVSPVRKGARP